MKNKNEKRSIYKNKLTFAKLCNIFLLLLLFSNVLQNTKPKISNTSSYKKLGSINNNSHGSFYSISKNSKIKIFDAYKISEEYNEGAFLPDIALDDNGIIHTVWYSSRYYREDIIYRNYSIADENWSNITIISEGVKNKYSQYPIIKLDSRNRIHVIWRERGTQNYLKYRYYNGSYWGDVKTVVQLNKTTFAHDLVVDKDENIHFVWNNKNKTQNYELFFRSYSLINDKWTNIQQITNSSRASLSPNLAIDASNNMHLVWVQGTTNSTYPEIQYKKILDNNWTLNSSIIVSNPDDIISQRPSITLDENDILHIVWEDSTYPYYNIYYRNINSGNLSEIKKINSSNDGFHPSVYSDRYNNQYITWYESEKILFIYFVEGKGWSDNFIISDQELVLFFPQIVIDTNQFFIIWNDYSHEGSWEIYFINGRINKNLNFLYVVIPISITFVLGSFISFVLLKKKK